MSDLQLLPHYQGKRVRKEGKSYYVDEHGKRYPSVTSILNATKPQADREALQKWRSRIGKQQAQKIAANASRRGTGTHKHIQNYLLGKAGQCPENVLPYWESIVPVLKNIQQVRLVEALVCHPEWGYGGVVDCIASYQGIPCVCDWKTAYKPKNSVSRLYDAPLQIAAYQEAANHFYQDYGLEIKHGLVVVAIPEMPAEVFWFEPETMSDYSVRWQERLKLFWQQHEHTLEFQ